MRSRVTLVVPAARSRGYLGCGRSLSDTGERDGEEASGTCGQSGLGEKMAGMMAPEGTLLLPPDPVPVPADGGWCLAEEALAVAADQGGGGGGAAW